MKSRKKQEKIVRYLFRNSLTNDTVDEAKVKEILRLITKEKPPQLLNILKIYKKMVERTLLKEELIIEAATKVADKKFEQEILNKTKAKRIKYQIKPNLVLGMRITHGDWVYDETLQAKLAQLLNG